MALDAKSWVSRYAEALGAAAPSEAELAELLDLAAVAALAAERTAAPVSCWLAATARAPVQKALAAARDLAASLEETA